MTQQDAAHSDYEEFRRLTIENAVSNTRAFVKSIIFSVDNTHLICGTGVGIFTYEIETGNIVYSQARHRTKMLDVSSDGTLVVSTGYSDVVVWTYKNLAVVEESNLSSMQINAIKFVQPMSRGPYSILIGGRTGLVILLTLKGEKIRFFDGHGEPVQDVAVFACINRFVSISSNGRIKVWDIETGEKIGSMRISTERYGKTIALSKDGLKMAVGAFDGSIIICNPVRLKVTKTFGFKEHTNPIVFVKFGCDDSMIISGCEAGHMSGCEGVCCLWSVDSGQCLQKLAIKRSRILDASFSLDGTKIATVFCGMDTIIRCHSPLRIMIPNFYLFQTWIRLSQKKTTCQMPRAAIQLIGKYMFESTLLKPIFLKQI
jgi:WD40 repeat protein